MARRGHRCPGLPGVCLRIEGFILVKGSGSGFTAEDKDSSVNDGGRDATARSWHRRPVAPPIQARIIFLVDGEVARVVAVQSSADRVECAVYGSRSEMIPGREHRSALDP